MNILVTGGAGFIGSHLVELLLTEGHTVTVLDNFLTGTKENLDAVRGSSSFRIVSHDVSAPFPDEITGMGYERIYNLASPASPASYGRYPIETLRANAEGMFNVLTLAEKYGARVLQASTSEIYGDPLVHPQPETYWGNVNSFGPRSCYDEGKRYAESMCFEFHHRRGVDVRIARIFNTYGPRSHPEDGRVVPNFCVQALSGLPLTIYGSGDQTRSFCYVEDLVDGLIRLMEAPSLAGEVVNLGNDSECTINEFAETLLRVASSPSHIVHMNLPADDPKKRRPDLSRARQLLDWEPAVELEVGLSRTLAYFRQYATPLNTHSFERRES